MRWPQDFRLWRLISSGLSAPVLILGAHTFQHPLRLVPPHILHPTETRWLFLWHPLLPGNTVYTWLRLRAASLTHWTNVRLFVFTGQPSPHHCQRRLTRPRPLCKYLLSLSVQYGSLFILTSSAAWMCRYVCVWMRMKRSPGSKRLFTIFTQHIIWFSLKIWTKFAFHFKDF